MAEVNDPAAEVLHRAYIEARRSAHDLAQSRDQRDFPIKRAQKALDDLVAERSEIQARVDKQFERAKKLAESYRSITGQEIPRWEPY